MPGCNVRSRQNFVCTSTYIEKDFFTSQVTRHYYWSKFKGINIIRGNGAFVFSPPKFLRLLAFVENLGFFQKPNFLRLVFARKFRPHINKIQKINKNFTKNCQNVKNMHKKSQICLNLKICTKRSEYAQICISKSPILIGEKLSSILCLGLAKNMHLHVSPGYNSK